MTTYVVLTKDDSGFWKELSVESAHGPKAAVYKAFMRQPGDVAEMLGESEKAEPSA
jgi:hypothetical protein